VFMVALSAETSNRLLGSLYVVSLDETTDCLTSSVYVVFHARPIAPAVITLSPLSI